MTNSNAQVISLTEQHSPALLSYDYIVVAFSGGKDSAACVLLLLDLGVPKEKIILIHHDVDGEESTFMDWPCTKAYCQAFAKAFGLTLLSSYKEGGFKREMLRQDALTAPSWFESLSGGFHKIGGKTGKYSTRLKFPQKTHNLNTRWCSAYLKIGVSDAFLNNERAFQNARICFVSGERGEESAARKRYDSFIVHRCDNRNGLRNQRHIDHWRPILNWAESKVWDMIKKYSLVPHPAYWLGFGRCSCLTCIFASDNQWATIRKYFPANFNQVRYYESLFGHTITHGATVSDLADNGTPYDVDVHWLEIAKQTTWTIPIITKTWTLPNGAFGESAGPT
ncbi:phosphoadenosine phosphosulfate reductase domain-containing protein [Alteromonas macleodii]|uniref:Phosphoadenosine phosphosulfate reductase family protein n=1 Tax=Alteromonas macleodii TaxID=28108 RepID=A0AB36FLW4_ALTMA|nr:phosphoadenosine phosphosulfate reductase family protein [Alteromonas macleodii]OES24465.1 phosphoadenosine phosphosulfate reductase family protein [Alteromonas macleodii]OES25522.1 phosphoadenosine phosphosulfate reductase family protein [Alteromonas macleodii]OES25824.1 phosphoadenosine phosphosulfate reductase family protein [Alteromonas macleodii]OES38656.1 phosphoadenosine phosphosulfate reductase family protein [Alteromonas macleodii]